MRGIRGTSRSLPLDAWDCTVEHNDSLHKASLWQRTASARQYCGRLCTAHLLRTRRGLTKLRCHEIGRDFIRCEMGVLDDAASKGSGRISSLITRGASLVTLHQALVGQQRLRTFVLRR